MNDLRCCRTRCHSAGLILLGSIEDADSVDGRASGPLTGVYNARKTAVDAVSESRRQELTARGIRVVIEPRHHNRPRRSITHTPTRDAVAEFSATLRSLEPDDVAAAALYAAAQPSHVAVNEIPLRSVDQQR